MLLSGDIAKPICEDKNHHKLFKYKQNLERIKFPFTLIEILHHKMVSQVREQQTRINILVELPKVLLEIYIAVP